MSEVTYRRIIDRKAKFSKAGHIVLLGVKPISLVISNTDHVGYSGGNRLNLSHKDVPLQIRDTFQQKKPKRTTTLFIGPSVAT